MLQGFGSNTQFVQVELGNIQISLSVHVGFGKMIFGIGVHLQQPVVTNHMGCGKCILNITGHFNSRNTVTSVME